MRDLVDEIDYKKGEINSFLVLQNKPIMFDEKHEGPKRRRILGTPCNSEADLAMFSLELYKAVYEETKAEKNGAEHTKVLLGKFHNHPFTFYVSALRHSFGHSLEEKNLKGISILTVYKKYLNREIPPATPEDFQTIQKGLLTDFLAFLNEIYSSFSQNERDKTGPQKVNIDGKICVDESGNYFCKDVLLPKRLENYIGSVCHIRIVKANTMKSKGKYPFFAALIHSIDAYVRGLIMVDKKGCHFKDIELPESLHNRAKSPILIKRIKGIKGKPYFNWEPVDYELPKIEVGKEYTVDIDNKGNTHINGTYIGKKSNCKKGDIVVVNKIVLAVATTPKGYDFVAVVKKLNTETPTSIPTPKVLTVEKSEDGVLHAENYILDPSERYEVGDRLVILKTAENPDPKTKGAYPIWASHYAVLDPNNPDAEEKAIKILNKIRKYIPDSLYRIGLTVVKTIYSLLKKAKILKN